MGERRGGNPFRAGGAGGGNPAGPGHRLPPGGGGPGQSLAQGYEAEQAGVRLVRLEESWQLVSAPQWGETIRGLLSRRKPDKLSPAALETLAVVAYFQPVTRVVIDQVRGVDSAHSLALLLDRELVAPCGSLDAPGRPILYRTTPVFLRSFGLSSLEELPPLPESGLNREEGQPW